MSRWLLLLPLVLCASEEDALRISGEIQHRHLPHGVIMDPVWQDGNIRTYSRAGDSAIWTGHYLAAEAFRYKVTGSDEALAAVKSAIAGIRSLVDCTGTGLLARSVLPVDSPYGPDVLREEERHGFHQGQLGGAPVYWIGNTSRDQYLGVFFGLSVAHEFVNDDVVRAEVKALVTRMLDFLLRRNWVVVMPDGRASTTFLGRPDQQLAMLQVGRQVNSSRFAGDYRWMRFWTAAAVIVPIATEVLDDTNSYFKFNLDVISLFSLIRLEDDWFARGRYQNAYAVLRRTIDDHGNAHFNMIDRALRGPDDRRDAATRDMLDAWLLRPRFDEFVDLRGVLPSCGAPDRACEPIPIEQRVRTDFLWQRSPFLLYGGGEGNIEGAGIDYILPYWMARFYGVL